jgi:hypothetical protein
MRTEGIVALQVPQVGRDHLALLTERAGHQRDLGAFGGVPGEGGSGPQGLVVRVGVDDQQPARVRRRRRRLGQTTALTSGK